MNTEAEDRSAQPSPTLQLVPNTCQPANGSKDGPGVEIARSGAVLDHHRVLRVRPWIDPKWLEAGHDPRSAYVERFWVGILGPSVAWLLRLIAREFDDLAPNEELCLDLEVTARRLGVQHRGGRHSTMMRTIDRCCTFDVARLDDDGVLFVRTRMPPVPRALRIRMPEELRDEVGHWTRTGGSTDVSVGEMRLLASCMLMLGNGLHESAEQLVRLGLEPRGANEATAWAWAERCLRAAIPASPTKRDVSRIRPASTSRRPSHDHQPQTSSTSVRTPKPVAPLESSPASESERTGPAMST